MRKILIFMILVLPLSLHATSGRAVEWLKIESDHFIYLYHTEVASIVTEVIKLSEETYEQLSNFYSYEPEEKIIMTLKGYEDFSNGYAFSSGRVMIITLGDFYPYRVDGYWLKTVISHELGHIFQLSMVNDFLRTIRPFISRYLTPNALQPLWMSEGFAQFSSELMSADSYDYRRSPYLLDGLSNPDLFDNIAIVNGESPIGYEAAYNFGYAFIKFLINNYGYNKLIEFLNYKSSFLRSLWGINTALMEVYGKNFKTLKAEFIKTIGLTFPEPRDIPEPFLKLEENEEVLKLAVCNGKLFFITINRKTGIYKLYREKERLYSFAYPIVDFSVNGNKVGLILMEKDKEGLQSRLYLFDISGTHLRKTDFTHVLKVELLNEETAVVVENKFSTPTVKLISFEEKGSEILFASPDPLIAISQISLSPGARYLAMRVNDRGNKYLLFYDFLKHSLISYRAASDFSIGGWKDGFLLIASKEGNASQILSFLPEIGKQRVVANFPRSVLWPVSYKDEYVISALKEGFKIFKAIKLEEKEVNFFNREPLRTEGSLEAIEGKAYTPTDQLRFESFFPYYFGFGLYFEDYLSALNLSVAAGYNTKKKVPEFSFSLKSIDYYPVDMEFNLSFEGVNPGFYCELKTPNLLNAPFYLSPGIVLSFFPRTFSTYLNLGYIDSTEILGGRGTFKNFIKIKDVQSVINTMELSGTILLEWKGKILQLKAGTAARAILFGDPYIIPFTFSGFESRKRFAFGLSLSAESSLGTRDFEIAELLYFFNQGVGGKLSLVLDDAPIQFSITLYKYETLNLYGGYPIKLSLGFSFENMKLKPYFNIGF
ncbi:hypothetical protein [Kosmotoga pacifica]|uniref:Peptidase MA-like domain-containing protein n=1 Tax=Kosmotoga pacifica TaxID=1330330 RepID=A0A0G2Z6N5_9BACT|nr:hypothetical protein [Kosmotoga pacifica]AKI97270.1 hypothetical protein IX53_04955 [Kosmotoga pacifica]